MFQAVVRLHIVGSFSPFERECGLVYTAILVLHFMWEDTKVAKELRGTWQAEWRARPGWAPWESKQGPSIGTMNPTPTGYVQSVPALSLRDGVIGKAL